MSGKVRENNIILNVWLNYVGYCTSEWIDDTIWNKMVAYKSDRIFFSTLFISFDLVRIFWYHYYNNFVAQTTYVSDWLI